ncbi:sterol desaturase family protein [Defluviimonas aestuarii]|uniref:sterol desaturase family protein n=1 Tax=Albidovulum aestuarii TaxID=1130726 RepID=UPI00249C1D76|nr:sterol desaturase family protein [Defluviimonas aestuarii]MDI3335193.1 sterol desaturase family protein [Defluviimonas aestuarii]
MSLGDDAPMSREWNYHPDLPLADPSIFRWPPDPGFLIRWLARHWLMLSERVMMVILAVLLYLTAYPALETAQSFSLGWVAQVWAINMGLVVAVAGGLHWYFYMRKGQGRRLKFDHKDQARGNRLWNFADQVHDNMFWTLGPGVAFLTLWQVVTMWLMANGHVPVIRFAEHPVWFVLALMLLPIWSAFHFYWVHRFLHVPFLYRTVHSLHHRNVNIGPWSGMSMHPVETFLYFSSFAIHWIVPTHPVHLIFHVLYQGPGAAMTHTGYEDLLIKDKRRLALGTFYHQLHHRYYECNYGNQEMPWDRWFGTFHDGTEAGTKDTRARKKRMYGQ